MIINKIKKLFKKLLYGHCFEIGQVVILTHTLKYFGWINTVVEHMPKYWIVTGISKGNRINLEITACRWKERQIPKYMRVIWVEHKHVQLASNMVQVLYGEEKTS